MSMTAQNQQIQGVRGSEIFMYLSTSVAGKKSRKQAESPISLKEVPVDTKYSEIPKRNCMEEGHLRQSFNNELQELEVKTEQDGSEEDKNSSAREVGEKVMKNSFRNEQALATCYGDESETNGAATLASTEEERTCVEVVGETNGLSSEMKYVTEPCMRRTRRKAGINEVFYDDIKSDDESEDPSDDPLLETINVDLEYSPSKKQNSGWTLPQHRVNQSLRKLTKLEIVYEGPLHKFQTVKGMVYHINDGYYYGLLRYRWRVYYFRCIYSKCQAEAVYFNDKFCIPKMSKKHIHTPDGKNKVVQERKNKSLNRYELRPRSFITAEKKEVERVEENISCEVVENGVTPYESLDKDGEDKKDIPALPVITQVIFTPTGLLDQDGKGNEDTPTLPIIPQVSFTPTGLLNQDGIRNEDTHTLPIIPQVSFTPTGLLDQDGKGNEDTPTLPIIPQTTDNPVTAKNNKKKKGCIFCKKTVLNFARHISRRHKDEPLVQEAMSYPLRSETRMKLIKDLRNEGKFNVSFSGLKQIKKKRKLKYVPCIYCRELFVDYYLPKHGTLCRVKSKVDSEDSEDASTRDLQAVVILDALSYGNSSLFSLTKDLMKLRTHALSVAEENANVLKQDSADVRAYKCLAEAVLVMTVLFNNCKEVKDVQYLTVSNYKQDCSSDDLRELLGTFTDFEKKVIQNCKIVLTGGKESLTTVVLFPRNIECFVDLILELRNTSSVIIPENPYLFAYPNTKFQQIPVAVALQKLVQKSALEMPSDVICNGFRKEAAIVLRILNMDDLEIKQLSTFLNDAVRICDELCDLLQNASQVAKVAKILKLLEEGELLDFKYKTLKEAQIDTGEETEEEEEPETIQERPKSTSYVKTERKHTIQRWSEKERNILRKHFEYYIKHKISPKKRDVVNVMNKYPSLFKNRTWVVVKAFVYNCYRHARKNSSVLQDHEQKDNFTDENNEPKAKMQEMDKNNEIKKETRGKDENGIENNETKKEMEIPENDEKCVTEEKMEEIDENIEPKEVMQEIQTQRVGRKQHKKNYWSKEEKQIIMKHFGYFIENKISPRKRDVESVMNKYHSVFKNRTWVIVKAFVYNCYRHGKNNTQCQKKEPESKDRITLRKRKRKGKKCR